MPATIVWALVRLSASRSAVFMDQMGHMTANLTLSVYAKAMAWRDGERERLRALVEGPNGQSEGNTGFETVETAEEREAA